MSEEFRASAKADSDLDPIRDEPAFQHRINDYQLDRGKSDTSA